MLQIDRHSPTNVKPGCTNIKLWEKKDILNLHFVKRGKGYANCDVIRFYHKELAQRVANHLQVAVFNPDSDSTYYEIDARNYNYAFTASRQLEVETNKLWTPLRHVQGLCAKLQAKKYITPNVAEEIERSFTKKCSVQEYEGAATEYRDVEKALTLAHYHNKPDAPYTEDNLYWLLQAFIYSERKDFGHLIDLDEYFKNITYASTAASFKTSVDVFKDNAVEILNAMARSDKLNYLKLSPYTHYTKEIAERIGSFLTDSSSIRDVDLSSTYSARAWTRLNQKTISPIAEALITNTSITYLNLSGMELGDKGILKILYAIKSNPNSKVSHLCLNDCGMTDISGEEIFRLMREKNSALEKVECQWVTQKLAEEKFVRLCQTHERENREKERQYRESDTSRRYVSSSRYNERDPTSDGYYGNSNPSVGGDGCSLM